MGVPKDVSFVSSDMDENAFAVGTDRSADLSRGLEKSPAHGLPSLPRSWEAASVEVEQRSSGMGRK